MCELSFQLFFPYQVKQLPGASDIPAESTAEFTTMLQFYHDLGTIMHHPTAKSSLQTTVILDPHWLIDVFRRVVTVLDRRKQVIFKIFFFSLHMKRCMNADSIQFNLFVSIHFTILNIRYTTKEIYQRCGSHLKCKACGWWYPEVTYSRLLSRP